MEEKWLIDALSSNMGVHVHGILAVWHGAFQWNCKSKTTHQEHRLLKEKTKYTCMATGKSSAKSGGKNRSACFFVKDGFPEKFHSQVLRIKAKVLMLSRYYDNIQLEQLVHLLTWLWKMWSIRYLNLRMIWLRLFFLNHFFTPQFIKNPWYL